MQQVAELVEEGLDLLVREEGGRVADGRADVGAEEPHVRVLRARSVHESVHPRPTALVLARVEVDVEGSDHVLPFVDAEAAHALVPCRRGALPHLDAVELARHLEEAREDRVDGEVRAEELVVEVEARLAHLLGVVAEVPRAKRRCVTVRLSAERFQLGVLSLERRHRPRVEVGDERGGLLSRLRHAVVQHEVGEVGETEQLGLALAQRQDLADERPVVVGAAARSRVVGAPDLLADLGVVQVEHDGQITRALE